MSILAGFKVTFEELKACGNLPSPTGVALEIIRLSQNPDTDIEELVRPVQSDPALTARLLKLANSAQEASYAPIISVKQAIIRLGSCVLARLTLTLSVLDKNLEGSCQAFNYDFFWSTSLLRGLAMQRLSILNSAVKPDEAFSIGLLAEIGRLALAQIYPQEYADCLQKESGTLLERERAAFIIDHQQVTVEMLRDWGIPDWILTAVAQYYTLQNQNFDSNSLSNIFTTQLRLASILAGDINLNESISDIPVLLERLNMNQQQLLLLRSQLFQDWCDWGKLLAIPTDDLLETLINSESFLETALETDALRILVVDDNRAERLILKTYLTGQGYHVDVAANGEEALQQLYLSQPHIIITDYHMSPIDGLKLTKTIKSNQFTQSAFVILVTAETDLKAMSNAFDAGVNDFIAKPIQHSELASRIIGARIALNLQKNLNQERDNVRRQAFELATAKRRVELLAITDQLTNLYNRRYAVSRLDQEWASFLRDGHPIGLLSLDLDLFKQINDNFGHDIGDEVLRHFAKILRQSIRADHIACRMGGEEFIVIAPNTDLAAISILSERIRDRVEKLQPEHLKLPRLITISIGAAVSCSHIDLDGWQQTLKRSDQALYFAKASGRNNCKISEGSLTTPDRE